MLFAWAIHVPLRASSRRLTTAPGDYGCRSLPERRSRPAQAPFRPSRPQQAYLEAWLDPQAPKTISGIATHIAVPRRTVHHWLANDDFVAWFNAEIQQHTEHRWAPVLLKVAQLALQGSIDHVRLLAQIRGAIRLRENPAADGLTVVVGVPRPASRPAAQLLPPK